MRAYDEQYLDDAMRNLGEAADYAVNACKMSLQKFFDLFVATGFATQFGNGVPKIISGLSGTELVHEIVVKAGIEQDLPEVQTEYDCSPEYWCGWIVAYYQWNTGRTFKDIFQNVSAKEIEKLYPTLHEAHEDKFVDVARLYYKTTGQKIKFVPMYHAANLKKVVFGNPIEFDPALDMNIQRKLICNHIKDEITRVAKDLPRHKVIPYNNISKKKYPYSK